MINNNKEVIRLMTRYNRIGAQLPTEAAVLDKHTRAAAIANARLLLAEMNKVKAQIDLALGVAPSPLVDTSTTEPDDIDEDQKEDSEHV